MDNYFSKINTIDFIISETCNLNCSYCNIPKNNLSLSHNQVKDALLSGKYLNTYKYFITEYGLNKDNIKEIQLWGGEPTLTLEAFNTQIIEILDYFPNVTQSFFSTNCTINIQSLINYIQIINSYCKENNRIFTIRLQISFDGFKYTESQRNISSNIIINNIKQILNIFNNIELSHNIKILLFLHGVLNIDNIKQQLEEQNNQYWQQINNIIKNLKDFNKNQNIQINPYTAYFQLPFNASKQDGELLTQYAKYCLQLYLTNELKYVSCLSPFNLILFGLRDILQSYSIDSIIEQYNLEYDNIPDFIKYLNSFYSCGINQKEIKLRYDGTLLYCDQNFTNLDKLDLKQRSQFDQELLSYQLENKNFQPNILTQSKENINNFLKLFQIKEQYYYSHLYANNVNLMYLLLKNHQIDSSYNDFNKILKHAFYISKARQCFKASIMETGSFYNTTLGFIRQCCNGLLDILEPYALEYQTFKKD